MEKNSEIKKQIALLVIVAMVMIVLSIIFSSNENESKSTNTNTAKENSNEIVMNGIDKNQLENLKGLLNDETYNKYKNYLEGNEVKEDDVKSAEDLIKAGENTDYMTSKEKDELDNELEEALRIYGN